MKKLHMRGCPAELFLLNGVLSALIIGFSVFALYVIQHESVPGGVGILVGAMVCVFLLIPGVAMLLEAADSFFTQAEVFDDRIVFSRPLRKSRSIPLEQITFFGCCAWAARSGKIFFCTEDPADLEAYLQCHWDQCSRFFGPHRLRKLSSDETGRIRLAIGTYLRCSRKNVIWLGYGSTKRIHQIVRAMRRDAILTGSFLIDQEPAWIKYSVFDSE